MSAATMFEALLRGHAFIDLSSWRKIAVTGADAREWLNDLISADVAEIGSGQARHSLLLSPTGRVRATFTVTPWSDGLLLLQDPGQPHAIDALLERYVLSSDVALENVTEDLSLFALPGASEPPRVGHGDVSSPSCLGSGIDVLAAMDRRQEVMTALATRLSRAEMEDVEAWRVFRGVPRFGVDAGEDDLPQEGTLEDAVSFEKGCYVGQEAVAKVRNLGHPRRLVLHLEASAPVAAGESVCVDGAEVGWVTSAVETPKGARALVKLRWGAREGPFVTPGGARLVPVS